MDRTTTAFPAALRGSLCRIIRCFAAPVFSLGAMLAAQTSWHDPPILMPRSGSFGAHDAARGLTWLLGGWCDANHLDLWSYDGQTWRAVAPAPFAGWASSLAFDAARDRLVAVLGSAQGKRLAEFDGSGWQLLQPVPYTWTNLVYDTTRNQMLLHTQGSTPPGQLRLWNGTALVPLGIPTAPAGSMAFDSARGRAVIVHYTGTYEWDGSTWRSVLVEPPTAETLAFDPTVQKVVLYSRSMQGPPGEQWEWDGSAWSSRPTGNAPRRRWPMVVGEVSRQRLLLFGGNDVCQRGDTWAFDGVSWQQVAADPGGPPMVGARAASDRQRRLLLFGGTMDGQPTDQTWVLDAQTWARLQPAQSPAPRTNHCLAADAGTGDVYLFGGTAGSGELGDAWRFDGAEWLPLPAGPGARSRAALCFDSVRRRLVLYGGQSGSVIRSDTWEFDGLQWQQRVAAWPPNDGLVHMAFDARRRRCVLITSGLDQLQTWEWDGSSWYSTDPPQRPRLSTESTLLYEPERQRVVLVQGMAPMPAPGPRGEAWEWDGSTWRLLGSDARIERHLMAVAHVAGRGVLAYGGEGLVYTRLTHAVEMRSDHPATAASFGSACTGSAGVPVLAAPDLPWTGDCLALEVVPVAPTALAVLSTAFSATSWLGLPLPIDLGPHGFPGCWLHVGPESAIWMPVQQGIARASLPVPPSPALVGLQLFVQALLFEGAAGVATSAGLRLMVGQR